MPPPLILARPKLADLGHINDLILRSKANWGYDAAFMDACVQELEITPELLGRHMFMTAIILDKTIGIVEVAVDGSEGHLEKLFIDPDAMRCGAGRWLFDWAKKVAMEKGARHLLIEADPDAEGFYIAMGAKRIGSVASGSIAGRTLPLLEYKLTS